MFATASLAVKDSDSIFWFIVEQKALLIFFQKQGIEVSPVKKHAFVSILLNFNCTELRTFTKLELEAEKAQTLIFFSLLRKIIWKKIMTTNSENTVIDAIFMGILASRGAN